MNITNQPEQPRMTLEQMKYLHSPTSYNDRVGYIDTLMSNWLLAEGPYAAHAVNTHAQVCFRLNCARVFYQWTQAAGNEYTESEMPLQIALDLETWWRPMHWKRTADPVIIFKPIDPAGKTGTIAEVEVIRPLTRARWSQVEADMEQRRILTQATRHEYHRQQALGLYPNAEAMH